MFPVLYRLRMKKRWRRHGATNRDVRTRREEQAPGCLVRLTDDEMWEERRLMEDRGDEDQRN